jgi:hypothetical protein
MSTIVKEVKSFNFSTVTSLKTPHKRGKEVKVFYETASFLYLNIRKHYSPPSPTPPYVTITYRQSRNRLKGGEWSNVGEFSQYQDAAIEF